MTDDKIRQLKVFKKNIALQETQLDLYCIDYLLKNYDNDIRLKIFLEDLLSYGCISGMIGELVSYHDTNNFYDKYETEINSLIQEELDGKNYLEKILTIDGANNIEDMQELKNLLSWFAFEHTMAIIYYRLFGDK